MQKSDQRDTERTPIAPLIQEPLLTYDPHTNRWSGANAHFSIWMDDATFRAYVAVWYEQTTWLADRPVEECQAAAIARCQRLSYWAGCDRNGDHRVHITYH